MPLLSIITPLFNKAAHVGETIRSVLSQTERNWEMIIVDNNSTDGGPEVVRRAAGSDPRIYFTAFHSVSGPGATRNCGLDLAKGEWILFLDADDVLKPEFLGSRLAKTRTGDKADVIAGPWQEFSDASPGECVTRYPAAWLRSQEELEAAAIAFAPWAVHAAIVHKDRFDTHVRWQEGLDNRPSEDTAFWFRVVIGAHVAWDPSEDALYRKDTINSRNAIRDAQNWFEGVSRVIKANVDYLHFLGRELTPAHASTLVRVFEAEYQRALEAHDVEVAQAALLEASKYLRLAPKREPGMFLRRVLGVPVFSKLRGQARQVDRAL